MNLWKKAYFFSMLIAIILLHACQKDRQFLEGDVKIAFSADTLRFDTVFTALGSATKLLKIYNPNNGVVNISNISLDKGTESFFRLNIDGAPGGMISNVQILPQDSLYIFAEVTIDPDLPLSISPFIIQEYLKFDVNGNEQQVLLEAWGQNANYLPNRFAQGVTSIVSCELGEVVFEDPKPYVIYGWLLIDSCHVVLPAGTRIYVHGGVTRTDEGSREEGLIGILPNGRISANGTVENPVIIEGDRLEEAFENKLGQWNGISIFGSKGNRFTNAVVKNAIDGFYLDARSELKLENTQVYNHSRFGLVGLNATVEASNCLFHTCGANSVALVQGGDHNFEYCTISNFGNETEALLLSNEICLAQDMNGECTQNGVNRLKSRFKNCIIAGDDEDELGLNNAAANNSRFDYFFQNCIVVVDELTDTDNHPNFFENCSQCDNVDIRNEKLFLDFEKNDFSLDTMSIAEMQAVPINLLPFDIKGNMRDISNPDIGCYEFQN